MQNSSSNIANDHEAFHKLFNEYYSSLCRFATSYIGNPNNAEDIVQQIFVNLWEKGFEIDPNKTIKTYLFTSVKNRCLNYIRDTKKYRSYYLDIEAELEIPVSEKDVFSEAELNEQLKKAINKLPEKCREIFMLCRFEDMKYKEIAQKLDISEKTVEAQMSKALKIMRVELKDYYFFILLSWFTYLN